MVYSMQKDFLSTAMILVELIMAEGQIGYVSIENGCDSVATLLGTKVYMLAGKPVRVQSPSFDVRLNWLRSIDVAIQAEAEYGRADFVRGDIHALRDTKSNLRKFLGLEDQQQLLAA